VVRVLNGEISKFRGKALILPVSKDGVFTGPLMGCRANLPINHKSVKERLVRKIIHLGDVLTTEEDRYIIFNAVVKRGHRDQAHLIYAKKALVLIADLINAGYSSPIRTVAIPAWGWGEDWDEIREFAEDTLPAKITIYV